MGKHMDMHHNVNATLGLSVQDITSDTTTSGEIIDKQGFESVEWGILSGTITDGVYTSAIYESDDSGMSGATVVPAEETLGTAIFSLAADSDEARRIGSVGKLRYQQLRIVSTGVTTGGTNFVSVAFQGAPHHAPVAEQT
jgi:hypothetical protein